MPLPYIALTSISLTLSLVCLLLLIHYRDLRRKPHLLVTIRSPRLHDHLETVVRRHKFSVDMVTSSSLHDMAKIVPSSFDSGSGKISQLHRMGYAFAVDLSNLEFSDAVRLVDFCDGLASGTGAWMFIPAEKVVCIMPTSTGGGL